MNEEIIKWLEVIEQNDGTPPEEVIAFNFGLFESNQGWMMYLVGGFEYSEDDDDWACIELPKDDYRYYRLPDKLQTKSWEEILKLTVFTLKELEKEGLLNKTLLKKAKAITTGFDEGELSKIR